MRDRSSPCPYERGKLAGSPGAGQSHTAAKSQAGCTGEGAKDSRWEWHPPAGTWPSCAALAASAAGAAAAGGCKQGVRGARARGEGYCGNVRGNGATHLSLWAYLLFPLFFSSQELLSPSPGAFSGSTLLGGFGGTRIRRRKMHFFFFISFPHRNLGGRGSSPQPGWHGSTLHPALAPSLARDSPAFVAVERVEEVGTALRDRGARELRDRGAGRAQCPLWLCKIQTDGGTRTPAFGSCPGSGREGGSQGPARATRVWHCRPRGAAPSCPGTSFQHASPSSSSHWERCQV